MLLYYITDRRQLPDAGQQQIESLLARIEEAAHCGIDFIQLRERDLSARQLELLATEALAAIRRVSTKQNASGGGRASGQCKLLINSRIDVALAVGAAGVHLRSTDINAGEARAIAARAFDDGSSKGFRDFTISASCHTGAEVRLAEAHGANLVLFGPVFEKAGGSVAPHRIAGLRAVCQAEHAARPSVPILALGGVNVTNAQACLEAGACGIAGIRLFQAGDLAETVHSLRALERM